MFIAKGTARIWVWGTVGILDLPATHPPLKLWIWTQTGGEYGLVSKAQDPESGDPMPIPSSAANFGTQRPRSHVSTLVRWKQYFSPEGICKNKFTDVAKHFDIHAWKYWVFTPWKTSSILFFIHCIYMYFLQVSRPALSGEGVTCSVRACKRGSWLQGNKSSLATWTKAEAAKTRKKNRFFGILN